MEEQMQNQNYNSNDEKKGFNITSMILGIIALLTSCFLPIIPIICAIISIIFMIIGRKKSGKAMGITGLVCSILSLLISIWLIFTLGIYIVNTSNDAISNITSQMSEMELLSFNNQFETYEGLQTGSTVKMLIRTINSSNDNNPNRYILIYINDALYETSTQISSSTKYEVSFEKDSNGFINKAIIKQ